MHAYYPLLLTGGIIGFISLILIVAYASIKDKKQSMGFDRHMKDGEIVRRLLAYARPYRGQFLFVGCIMLFGIAYDILSPTIIGRITDLIKDDFQLKELYRLVATYAGILIVSMVCTYVQAIVLQKVGQKIISGMREDLFTHIESLSHEQMNATPVGKLVTRVTNDTNAISLMFTSLLVNLVKNLFVIVGVLAAMIALNYELTLMVLCFVPFIVLFTLIFRKFARRAYRRVKDRTTDINTYLSENLSGIKITQIFNREEEKLRDFREKSLALGKAKRDQILVFGIFRPLVYVLYISSVLCLFFLGGKGYLDGGSFLGQTLKASTIVSFYMYINKFFNPIQNLAEQFNWLQSAFASAEKVFTIMDIRKIKTASLRRHFGQMLQDVFLFSGTIRSNILLGMEGVDDEQIMAACRYVNADHFIDRLEKGLDEPVRERGNNFSAGQRQLLSFARTILHKPEVMILDEATANIDTETEVLIQDSLEKMMNIGTMLIVAHRLSTIQHADNILVLSKGEIVEQGNHRQLLEQRGKYYQLYTLQFEKERLKNAQ